jgi:large subunit ribosomal protein L22
VAALIRDKQAEHALDMLRFCPKKVAYDVRKTLESAIANAENNLGLDVDTLFVTEVEVGKAFTLKRFAARGRGRSSRIEKPYSRLTVVVRQLQPLPDIAEQE